MKKKGLTPDEIRAKLKAKFEAMSPEQRKGFASHMDTKVGDKKKKKGE